MAEVCSAPLQLRIGASVVLDGRTAGMRESGTTRDRCQGNVDVVVVYGRCRRRRRRSCRPVVGGEGRRSTRRVSALNDAPRTVRQRVGWRRRQEDAGRRRAGRRNIAICR